MTAQGFTSQGSTTADNLLAGDFPRISRLVTVTGGNFKRGTLLGLKEGSLADGIFTISTSAPEAVLAEDVDASKEDKQAVVYLTGEFNLEALKANSDVTTLITKLRSKSIFVKNNQSY